MPKPTECKDHLGNVYSSTKDLCEAYKLKIPTYYDRLHMGWTLEEILTTPVLYSNKTCKDHLGKIYETKKAMCQHYGVTVTTFNKRINSGYKIKDALMTPTAGTNSNITPCKDHLGYEYNSIQNMCESWDVKPSTYCRRIKAGWSIEKALTTKCKHARYKDHLGISYDTLNKMCENYGITKDMYKSRKKQGWSLEKILTIPPKLYIGEYRVAECLKRLNVKFYQNCSIKTIFATLDVKIDWNEFLDELLNKLSNAGINWSKTKIQRLRPDFVIYTNNDNKIGGVIEFDGEQHQHFVEYFFKTVEEFYRYSNVDFAKQSLWEYLNIPMLRIRYDQEDLIDDMVKDFIDNPQKYIHNHNTYLSEDEYWSILSEEKTKLEFQTFHTDDITRPVERKPGYIQNPNIKKNFTNDNMLQSLPIIQTNPITIEEELAPILEFDENKQGDLNNNFYNVIEKAEDEDRDIY